MSLDQNIPEKFYSKRLKNMYTQELTDSRKFVNPDIYFNGLSMTSNRYYVLCKVYSAVIAGSYFLSDIRHRIYGKQHRPFDNYSNVEFVPA